MNVIYKYAIPLRSAAPVHTFDLPREAKVVHVGAQDKENVLIWVEQSQLLERPVQQRSFRVYGTGHPIDPTEVIGHIGSVVIDPFVWHVYEVV